MQFKSFNLQEFEHSSGPIRKQKAQELDQICQNSGFLILSGHGVPLKIIRAQWDAVSTFFAGNIETKGKVAIPYSGYPYGWIGPKQEALAASKGKKTPPDLKESFNGGPLVIPEGIKDLNAYEFCYQPTLWPEIKDFKIAWEAYYVEMERLARRLMSAFAEALGLDKEFFNPYISNPISALRALFYSATSSSKEVGQQRAGAHTDYGSLTILLPQPGTTGLQILNRKKWIPVPAKENCFVINIGDLMALWTSNRWVSTVHRVVAKPNQPARQSLAYFHQPDWDAVISPIKDSDTTNAVISGPYLMEKFKSTNLDN